MTKNIFYFSNSIKYYSYKFNKNIRIKSNKTLDKLKKYYIMLIFIVKSLYFLK